MVEASTKALGSFFRRLFEKLKLLRPLQEAARASVRGWSRPTSAIRKEEEEKSPGKQNFAGFFPRIKNLDKTLRT